MSTLVTEGKKPAVGGWRRLIGILMLFVCIHLTSCKAAISLTSQAFWG